MSKFLTAAIVAAMVMVGAASSQAQQVAMAGQYHESNGIIVNIPQNPPIVPCNPLVNDARCHRAGQHFFGTTAEPDIYRKPRVGVKAARLVDTAGGAGNGLGVGDPFVVPPFAFTQRLGLQVGIVLGDATRQLDTQFTAAMPRTEREKNPPALTRKFSMGNWNNPGNGQNNGLTGVALVSRPGATAVVNRTIGEETLQMTYTPGPRQFGGTMTTLLDNVGKLYLGGPGIDGPFPVSAQPVIATLPVGDYITGFRTRNAAGWDYTVTGAQLPGRFKGYFPPGVVAPGCTQPSVATPPGCNEVNGFDTYGVTLAAFGTATSTKYMFAFTTGTVSIVRTAVRRAVTQTGTVTAMGYDTIGVSTMGGPQRNVGLVAGSYTVRTDKQPTTNINYQMIGMNLKFTPEPGKSVALMSGLGVLALLAYRRRA
jgi:hypothetical protein